MRYIRTEYHMTRAQWTPPKAESKHDQLPNVCAEAYKHHEDEEWDRAFIHIERDTAEGKRHWTPDEASDIAQALFEAAMTGRVMDADRGLPTLEDEGCE